MKNERRRLPAILLALLVCCSLATAALAVSIDRAGAAQTGAETAADKGYTLREDLEIEAEETPLTDAAVQTRCVLHIVLLVLALAVGVCLLYSVRKHTARQRELLARLRA